MRCRPGYPTTQEPRGARYTEKEATEWLRDRLIEYNTRDQVVDTEKLRAAEHADVNHPDRINRRYEIANEFDKGHYPIPKPPNEWKIREARWKSFVRHVYTSDGYPFEDEMDNHLDYTEQEFTDRILRFGKALKTEQAEKIRRSFREANESQEAQKGKEPFRDDSPEPWELRTDQIGLDYEPTDRDVVDSEERLVEDALTNFQNGKRLEEMNAAEIDHPWHQYSSWSSCYTKDCAYHYNDKVRHDHFPTGQVLVYYDRLEMKEIILRRRSTGQLQSKN